MASTLDRQDQIRRDLVADVAHELRTPIAVLQAGHEALLDGVSEPTPAELASLRDEMLRPARMVGDLQDLAAADAAALHLDKRRCDLAQIAAAAVDSLARRFEAAGIAVDRQLSEVSVLGDPRWLHQVSTNLLSNALKFTPPGGRVIIGTRQAGPDALLDVTDTGQGIPADELPHVFDRFWRGQKAAQTSGSGIGLTVAAELARVHGGTLTAASQPGHGTRMTLTCPSPERLAYHGTAPDDGRDGPGRQQTHALLCRAVAARRKLADVEEALGRLASGEFGRCEQCGSVIPAGLLAALPRPGTARAVTPSRPGLRTASSGGLHMNHTRSTTRRHAGGLSWADAAGHGARPLRGALARPVWAGPPGDGGDRGGACGRAQPGASAVSMTCTRAKLLSVLHMVTTARPLGLHSGRL